MSIFPDQIQKTRQYVDQALAKQEKHPHDPQLAIAFVHIKVLDYFLQIAERSWELSLQLDQSLKEDEGGVRVHPLTPLLEAKQKLDDVFWRES